MRTFFLFLKIISLAGGLACFFYIFYTLTRKNEEEAVNNISVEYSELSRALWLNFNIAESQQHPVVVDTQENKPTTAVQEPGEQKESPSKPPATTTAEEINNKVLDFKKTYISPYIDIIREQGTEEYTNKLLDILIKTHPCPSIYPDPADEETTDIIEIIKEYQNITLLEHTFTVVPILLGEAEKTFSDFQKKIPHLIVLGLGYDIGKTKDASGISHTELSAEILASILPDEYQWKENIINAVKKHHKATTDQLTTLLKKADMRARNYEYAGKKRDIQICSFETWFDPHTFVEKYVIPKINENHEDYECPFELKGIVYLPTKTAAYLLKRMQEDLNVFDIFTYALSETENFLRKTIQSLREGSYIHTMLQAQRISMRSEIFFSDGLKRQESLIPLNIQVSEEIKNKSHGWKRQVVEVKVR